MAKKLELKLVESSSGVTVVDAKGETVAQFPKAHADLAKKLVTLPELLHVCDRLLDGVEGYLSEFGEDGRYWKIEEVEQAYRVLGKD